MPFLSAIFWFLMGAIVGTTFPVSISPAIFGATGFFLSQNQGNPGNLMRKTYLIAGLALMLAIPFTGGGLHYPALTVVGLIAMAASVIWFFLPNPPHTKVK